MSLTAAERSAAQRNRGDCDEKGGGEVIEVREVREDVPLSGRLRASIGSAQFFAPSEVPHRQFGCRLYTFQAFDYDAGHKLQDLIRGWRSRLCPMNRPVPWGSHMAGKIGGRESMSHAVLQISSYITFATLMDMKILFYSKLQADAQTYLQSTSTSS